MGAAVFGWLTSGAPAAARAVEARPQDFCSAPRAAAYTVPPRIVNVEEVQRAMVEAYPPMLRDAGLGGVIRVQFCVDATGRVANTLIGESSGNDALDEAALSVAGVYRFSAALNGDRATSVWVSFPLTFQVPR
jgi:TonB family protein